MGLEDLIPPGEGDDIDEPVGGGQPAGGTIAEMLKKMGLEGKFKNMEEILAAVVEADKVKAQYQTTSKQLQSMSAAAKAAGFNSVQEMMAAKGGGNGNNNRGGEGGPDYGSMVKKLLFEKHGARADDPQMNAWAGFFSDLLQQALNETLSHKSKEWEIEAMRDSVFGLKDEVGLMNFLNDPANAKLDRAVLPELKAIYQREGLYNKPEFHDGEWNGWKSAYDRLSAVNKLFGGPGQPAPPARTGPPPPRGGGLSYPDKTKPAPGGKAPALGRAEQYLQGQGKDIVGPDGKVDHAQFFFPNQGEGDEEI